MAFGVFLSGIPACFLLVYKAAWELIEQLEFGLEEFELRYQKQDSVQLNEDFILIAFKLNETQL